MIIECQKIYTSELLNNLIFLRIAFNSDFKISIADQRHNLLKPQQGYLIYFQGMTYQEIFH